jgi:hypothetical protein
VHQPTDLGLGGGIQAWPLTAGVRLGGYRASRTVAAQELLNKRKADAKHVGNRLLRAEPTLAGMQDFLPQINRIASHAS